MAAADVSYDRDSGRLFAAAVLYDRDARAVVSTRTVVDRLRFPYVPGLLSFREAPAVIRAVRGLRRRPAALLCDGHGIAHMRGFGLACHVGLLLDLPTVGCGKSRLVGEHEAPGPNVGDFVPLRYRGRVVGSVVRLREGAAPIYVSPGHRIGLAGARALVLACRGSSRVPEPIRIADRASRDARRGMAKDVAVEGTSTSRDLPPSNALPVATRRRTVVHRAIPFLDPTG